MPSHSFFKSTNQSINQSLCHSSSEVIITVLLLCLSGGGPLPARQFDAILPLSPLSGAQFTRKIAPYAPVFQHLSAVVDVHKILSSLLFIIEYQKVLPHLR